MSLINNVLRELDRRHASDSDRGGLPSEVRPLPDAPVRSLATWRILGAIVLAGGLGLGWFAYQRVIDRDDMAPVTKQSTGINSPTAPTVIAVSTPAEIAVSPAPTSGAMERSEISNTVAQPGTVATSQNAALTEEQLRLKFSTELSLSFSPGKASESSASTAMRPVVSVSEPASKPVPSVAAVHMTPAPKASPPAVVPAASVALAAPAPVAALPAKVRESVAATAPAPSQAASAPAITAASPAASVADDWAKAQVLVRAGSNDEAEVLLRKVLDSQPALVAPRQALVGLLLGARRFSEAIPVLKVGVQRLPQQTAWSMNLARLHVDAGDYPSAWEALATGLPHAQQQADYLAFAGTVLQRIDRPVDAATQYQASLRLRPEEARWWVGLGIALDASGHSVEAKTAFRRAKALGGYSADMGRYIDQKLQ